MLGIEKTVENESDGYTCCNWCSWYSHKKIRIRTRRLKNKGTSGDPSNYSIAKIGQNTEKSRGDVRDCCKRSSANTDVKNFQRVKIIRKTRRIMDFAVPADTSVEIKESGKRDMYVNLVREIKEKWHMKVTGIRMVISAVGIILKD